MVISINLPESLAVQARIAASKQNISRSRLITEVLIMYLQQLNMKQEVITDGRSETIK